MAIIYPTNAEIFYRLGFTTADLTALQTAQGQSFTAKANEVLSALVNKIVYQEVHDMDFANPFAQFDSYPVNYGDTIEEIYVELPDGADFDKDATNPFGKVAPSVKTCYATINYQQKYKITVEDRLIRRAVLNEYGMMNLISTIVSELSKRMAIDEYWATLATLNNVNIYAKGFEEVDKKSTAQAQAQEVTKTIVDAVSYMSLPNTSYNKLGIMTTSRKEDLLLIIKAKLLNSINLDYLAGVYNLSKVDLVKRIIPVETFQVKNKTTNTYTGEDLDFIIVDTKGFDNHVALKEGGMIYNPEALYTNHFSHLWKIISFKLFANARAFKIKTA